MGRRELGEAGEKAAREHLEAQGLEFRDGNVHATGGEIDLVMYDAAADEWVLVEVKTRRAAVGQYGSGAEAITAAKITKIHKAAERYFFDILQLDACPYYRVDGVVVVMNSDRVTVEWYKNIS